MTKNEMNLYKGIEKIKEALLGATENAKDKTREIVLSSMVKTNQVKRGIRHYVRQQPFKSLGFILGSGLMFGFLMGKKNRK